MVLRNKTVCGDGMAFEHSRAEGHGRQTSGASSTSAGGRTVDRNADLLRQLYSGVLLPDDMISTAQRTDQLFFTRRVERGEQVTPLAQNRIDLSGFQFESAGKHYGLADLLACNLITGLAIAKRGTILFETYQFGMRPDRRWMSMSMAKSISSALVGAALQDGYIGSIDDTVSTYVSALRDSAYEAVPIRDLLQMSSGVDWIETHTNPSSHRREMLELQIAQRPGEIVRFLGERDIVAGPGQRWNYSTGETHIVGALLAEATGRFLSDYLSEKLWKPLGMEADASWWLEAAGGIEVAGSGISATLRDYVRFGLFMMNGGRIGETQVLPEGWTAQGGCSRLLSGERVNYGYMWWVVPGGPEAPDTEAYCARGNHGQRIYVNETEEVVIGMLSARPKPLGSEAIVDNDFFNAMVAALRGL